MLVKRRALPIEQHSDPTCLSWSPESQSLQPQPAGMHQTSPPRPPRHLRTSPKSPSWMQGNKTIHVTICPGRAMKMLQEPGVHTWSRPTGVYFQRFFCFPLKNKTSCRWVPSCWSTVAALWLGGLLVPTASPGPHHRYHRGAGSLLVTGFHP